MPHPIQFHISGTIQSELNAKLSNVTVQVLHKQLRSEKLLMSGQTDSKGNYDIVFNPTPAEISESRPVDICIKAFSGELLLGQSKVYFGIGSETVIDLKVSMTDNLSEFDVLITRLKLILDANSVALGKLVENEEYQDITFLFGWGR
ncbi:hypothetical protein [Dyadobacter sp. NIV53]|uniref:hypothetical protein n=1 Tax=Dyadobacter sp. NIV53 TaxID=2861765 RepID=UPI001C8807E1|nr:hypothetical protein [Dyadobacter sp. NIV53]